MAEKWRTCPDTLLLQQTPRKGILGAGRTVLRVAMSSHQPCSSRLSRRTLLRATAGISVGLPVAAATDALLITPSWLSTTRIDMPAPPQAGIGDAADAPAARLAQLSDLHLKRIGRLEEQILEAVIAADPEVLLITGDAFDTARGIDVFDEFLAACPKTALVIGILGNWEYRSGIAVNRLAEVYERHGGRLLVNDSFTVDLTGGTLRVTGLDDLVEGKPQPDSGQGRRQEPHLLLAHCPGQRDQLGPQSRENIDLILSGHTHGGQVAPFGVALVTPGGSGRYVRGWYDDDGPPMYVSRGLGMSTLPVRLGVTPELVAIRWRLS